MYEQLELLATPPAPADRRTSPPWELLCYAPAGGVAGAIAADAPRFKRRFGQPPTVAWVHPAVIEAVGERAGGVALRARDVAYREWVYLGRV